MTFVHTTRLVPNQGASSRTAASSTTIVAAPATAATPSTSERLARIGPPGARSPRGYLLSGAGTSKSRRFVNTRPQSPFW